MIKINCYIINLEKYPEKRERIKNRLNNLKINYIIYDAIDGQNITNGYMEENNYKINSKWIDPFHNRRITLGEIGCALSHYNIMKLCLESEHEISLILEDDADFSEDFIENIEKCLHDLENIDNWDYCYLGRQKINNDIEEIISDNIIKPTYSYWCVGSLIHRRGCKKIVESNFLENIIVIDEFIPLISNVSPHVTFRNIYNTSINTYAYKNNIIFPEQNAFKNSDTEIISFLPNITDKIEEINNLKIITVATHNKEPLQRFKESCEIYNLDYKILGLNQEWKGGNMKQGMGGGMKINLLRDDLINYNDDDIIFFTDSYDTIFLTNSDEILEKYYKFNSDIVFSGEETCWPDKNLSKIFEDTNYKYKYINSGGFIGKVSSIKLLLSKELKDNYDDQLYIHMRYEEFKDIIKIDYTSEIFQTSTFSDIEIQYNKNRIINKLYKTSPCHLHGNGSQHKKIIFNNYSNYISKSWNKVNQYMKPKIIFNGKRIFIFIYLNENINNIDEFLKNIVNINYNKENIIYYVYNSYNYDISILSEYNLIEEKIKDNEYNIRDKSLKLLNIYNCDYYLNINSECLLEEPEVLNDLISYDKNIIAPLLKKNNHWSNFWGDINNNGWYNKSFNYYDIVNYDHKGCWNVPYINHMYLIKTSIIKELNNFYSLNYVVNRGCDMSFCENCRYNDIFMYVCNEKTYGKLVSNNKIDLYSFTDNPEEYINKYFNASINDINNLEIEEPIEDVLQFPLVNDIFCKELIELCENKNDWSGAKNDDKRIGYENVPTNDIHLSQLDLHESWNNFIKTYIAPIVSHRWGSFKTTKLNIGFIVKYDKDFKSLEPHHDSSSYTLNICLNDEFEGGEINFVKKNKTLKNKKGYCIIHPGRITHYHEALPVKNGNKFVFVSFVY